MRRIEVVFPSTRTTRRLRKEVPVKSGSGFTTVPDGEEELFYVTTVDMDRLDYVACCAAKSKRGLSKRGPLEVRILSRRRIA